MAKEHQTEYTRIKEGTERLETFNDGIFAIAMTLLVIDLKVPQLKDPIHDSLVRALLQQWPQYLSFAISFIVCELKRGKATLDDAHQLLSYSEWVGDTLAKGEHIQIQPILIASEFEEKVFTLFETIRLPSKPPLLLQYEYDGIKLRFNSASKNVNTLAFESVEKPNESRRNIPRVIKRNKAQRSAEDQLNFNLDQEKA